MFRAPSERQRRLCAAFSDWGIPTAQALTEVGSALPRTPIIVSGGLRSGMDLAKCLALGADLGGLAGPFLEAANDSARAVAELADEIGSVLRTTMFCLNIPDIESLKETTALRLYGSTTCLEERHHEP